MTYLFFMFWRHLQWFVVKKKINLKKKIDIRLVFSSYLKVTITFALY